MVSVLFCVSSKRTKTQLDATLVCFYFDKRGENLICYRTSLLVSFSVVLDKTNTQYVFSSRHLGAKKTILVGLSAQLVELVWYGVSTAEWGVWAAGMISY